MHRFYNAQRLPVAGPILPVSTGNISKVAVTSLRGSVCDLRASFVLPQSKSIMAVISEIRESAYRGCLSAKRYVVRNALTTLLCGFYYIHHKKEKM